MGIGVAGVTLRLSLKKGRYVGHLQWYIISKSPTEWANIYGSGVLGIEDNIFKRVGKKFTEIECLTQGEWIVKFMR